MIGFNYKITRSREPLELKKVVDDTRNLLRTRDPAVVGSFYDWATEIVSGREHLIKLFDETGAFYDSKRLATMAAHEFTTSDEFSPIAPGYGAGDTYTIYRREDNGTLTSLVEGNVSEYQPLQRKTYRMRFEITATDGGVDTGLFLVRQTNNIDVDGNSVAGAAVPQRVVRAGELYNLKREALFTLNPNKVGQQFFRRYYFEQLYKNQEEADEVERSLFGQLMVLFASFVKSDVATRTFGVIPGSGTIQVGQAIQFDAVGETGSVEWVLSQNASGAVITEKGLYRAGDTTGEDTIRVTDASGQVFNISLTVVNDYTSTFEGGMQWQT